MASSERAALLEEIEALERLPRKPMWAWWLVIVGLVALAGLAYHGYTAYATIAQIDVRSKIDTPNPVALFSDLATNGPRVGSTVETSSRAAYTRALEQFVLDGTGVGLGLTLVFGGLFIRLNS
jgi:hypothetical protein